MATKMLLRTGTYNQVLKLLNGRALSRAALTNCPRCFPFKFTSKPITTTGGIQISLKSWRRVTSVSLTSGATRPKPVASLQPNFHLRKRLLSGASTDDAQDRTGSSSEDTEKSDSISSQESDNSDILDKDEKNLSELSTEDGSGNGLQPVSGDVVDSFEEGKVETSGGLVIRTQHEENFDLIDDQEPADILAPSETPTVLEEVIQPYLPTESLTLATYVDHSPTLQKLVDLGVDLFKVEKKAKIGNMLIKMDFERHMKDKIILLHSVGVTAQTGLGRFLTINPFFLTEELQNLETRLRYLRSKKFSEDAITQVLNRAPYFLSFSVERLDSKLGFYQKEFSLTGNELRNIITRTPKLVTFKIQQVKENIFVCRRQLGFTTFELKSLVLKEPKILLKGKEKLIGMFDHLHNHMGISHKQILKTPQVFNGRIFRMQERHQFLKLHGRAQYDQTKPGYVALERLAKLPDDAFCREIAKSSVEEYENFLKTL